MATKDRIRKLVAKCRECGLDDAGLLGGYSPGRLKRIYNGIGPESFPPWLRGLVDALHPSLEPVALIHDLEWSQEDKSDERFEASNRRFRENGARVAKHEFGWWNPRRYVVMNQARRFANYCSIFGRGAFLAGGSK